MGRSAPSETHPAFPHAEGEGLTQTDPALGAGSATRSKLLDLSEPLVFSLIPEVLNEHLL